jgi:rhamnogalacturonan endolyase
MTANQPITRSLVFSTALLLTPGTALFAAQPATHDGGTVAAEKVDVSQDTTSVTLANREVTLVFQKKTSKLKSFTWHSMELLASGGAYIQCALTSKKDKPPINWEFHLCRREPGLVEIRFANADPQCPFILESHYILRADEPGFYNYLTWGHDAVRNPGVHELAQFNFCLRADPHIFTTAAVDDERIKPFPKPEWLTRQQMVMDATYRLPNGSFYSKYFYSAAMDERHTVHGMMGENIGLWIVMPSHEHLNGDPEHQELTVHQTDSSPVLLCHATAAHYGAGVLTSDSKNGSWSKVSAPWFVYVNRAANQAALWKDAKRRAGDEVGAWPYRWLDDGQFQLDRGTMTGRLVLDAGRPAGEARIILAQHEEQPSPLGWQRQWQGYRFYGWTDAEGRFSIPKVRPGVYDVYAWKRGVMGTFAHRAVRVDAGETGNTGDLVWNLPRDRKLLWQVGVPDRSAGEFGFAEDFRQWGLWDRIAEAFPNGVTYTVGKSKDRDLPFILAVTQNRDLSWREPIWQIRFEDRGRRSGQAILSLAIAAAEGIHGPVVKLVLNNESIGMIDDLAQSGAVHRSGLWGTCELREVAFGAAMLKTGTNVLAISLAAPGRRVSKPLGYPGGGAIMPDCLRLEIQEHDQPQHPPAKASR